MKFLDRLKEDFHCAVLFFVGGGGGDVVLRAWYR